ncbi:AAA family ATPase [Mariniblastus fucicola]|uniref:Uncharacterized AAA domain-containing protein ycf46 n=1 Tax=Mariniblastus fucicola TaxID=980251 RepID=A0A5B9PHK3_9BACT|nr:AAA family ATPase [Mariniblastus fucicola]QEG24780.1 ATP-dependent zinc metalloprotease FtsH 4 [Mariniblastus fucicola]
MTQTLSEELHDHISACFTGLWIHSHEHAEAIAETGRLCRDNDWNFFTWDVANGMMASGTTPLNSESRTDPLAAIRAFTSDGSTEMPSILVLKNFHRFLGNAEVTQTLAEQIEAGKSTRKFYVVLSPKTELPVELEKLFTVLDHRLPDREQLVTIATEIASDGELPEGSELDETIDAASGLTRFEAENAFALSVIREGRISSSTVQQLKSQTIRKSGLLTMHESTTGFDQLGGMDSAKEFCKKVLGSSSTRAKAKGILLLGVPGTGKSAFAKALGHEANRPTLVMDIGRLMGGIVGQSESNVRRALEIVDAMAPAILFIDELEKGLSGSGGGGRNDSGVSTRLMGSLLTWLSDHTSDVFVVATSNDISQLPPELTRAERLDGIFFCDLPSKEDKLAIWHIWMSHFGIDPVETIPDDEFWTGSEVRSCCRLASLLGVSLVEASSHVVPIAVTNREAVSDLRSWASNRCLSANIGGTYKFDHAKPTQRRTMTSVGPQPSDN